jgi:hypothetical protein
MASNKVPAFCFEGERTAGGTLNDFIPFMAQK